MKTTPKRSHAADKSVIAAKAILKFADRHRDLFPGPGDWRPGIEASIAQLQLWLNAAHRDGDKTVYSALLQAWLDGHGIGIMPGVFAFQLTPRRGGRPINPLRWRALSEWLLTDGASDGQIARKLLNDGSKKAADRIRILRKSAETALGKWRSSGGILHDEEARQFFELHRDAADERGLLKK